jgi:hypothetical protein
MAKNSVYNTNTPVIPVASVILIIPLANPIPKHTSYEKKKPKTLSVINLNMKYNMTNFLRILMMMVIVK